MSWLDLGNGISMGVVVGGPHGVDVKPGPIFDENGVFRLLALREVKQGEADAVDAFVYPDFSRPEVGACGTWAANFWNGWEKFYQDDRSHVNVPLSEQSEMRTGPLKLHNLFGF